MHGAALAIFILHKLNDFHPNDYESLRMLAQQQFMPVHHCTINQRNYRAMHATFTLL